MGIESDTNFLTQILLSFGSVAAVTGALIAWVANIWSKRILEKERNEYRKEIEELKAQLGKDSHETNTKFNEIYAKQAEATLELYKKLQEFRDNLSSSQVFLTAAEFNPDEGELGSRYLDTVSQLDSSYDALKVFYNQNKLLFSTEVCEIIDLLIGLSLAVVGLSDSVEEYSAGDTLENRLTAMHPRKEILGISSKVVDIIDENIAEIEAEFRELMTISTLIG
jgi:hypothetical protein